jgi:hypothetical protein
MLFICVTQIKSIVNSFNNLVLEPDKKPAIILSDEPKIIFTGTVKNIAKAMQFFEDVFSNSNNSETITLS